MIFALPIDPKIDKKTAPDIFRNCQASRSKNKTTKNQRDESSATINSFPRMHIYAYGMGIQTIVLVEEVKRM